MWKTTIHAYLKMPAEPSSVGAFTRMAIVEPGPLSAGHVTAMICCVGAATARWPLAARPALRAQPFLVTTDDDKPATADDDVSAIDLARRWWDETADFAAAFNIPKLEEDTLPAAVALHTALEASKESPSDSDFGELAKLTGDYYGACSERTFADPRVAERLPTVFNLLNGVLVLALLRIALPRLLAIQSMGDLYEFAPELGLPTRDELLGYVE